MAQLIIAYICVLRNRENISVGQALPLELILLLNYSMVSYLIHISITLQHGSAYYNLHMCTEKWGKYICKAGTTTGANSVTKLSTLNGFILIHITITLKHGPAYYNLHICTEKGDK